MEEKANTHILKNIEETKGFALEMGRGNKEGGVICLFGDLGSGKTSFCKYFAEGLGLDSFSIKSPTYTYFREYDLDNGKRLIHMDLYRIQELDELMEQELEEIFANSNNIVLIEWADRLEHILPSERIDLSFEYLDENTRQITTNDRRSN